MKVTNREQAALLVNGIIIPEVMSLGGDVIAPINQHLFEPHKEKALEGLNALLDYFEMEGN
jgi:hypothetical protein